MLDGELVFSSHVMQKRKRHLRGTTTTHPSDKRALNAMLPY